jgi:hypothetical protein
MMNKIILLILSFSISAYADMPQGLNYEHHLNKLVEEGHLNKDDAEDKIILKQIDENNYQNRKAQARGIASTLSKVKVYKIINEPIEIQP